MFFCGDLSRGHNQSKCFLCLSLSLHLSLQQIWGPPQENCKVVVGGLSSRPKVSLNEPLSASKRGLLHLRFSLPVLWTCTVAWPPGPCEKEDRNQFTHGPGAHATLTAGRLKSLLEGRNHHEEHEEHEGWNSMFSPIASPIA